MKNPQSKRRIKLIQPRFQLRLAGSFAALCLLALMVEALMLAVELTTLSKELPSGGAYLADEIPRLLARSAFWSALLLLPGLLVIGVRITFKIAGPLYRLEQHLHDVIEGKRPEPCKVRKGDELQEFCSLLNDALESARAQGEGDARQAAREANKSAA